MEWYYSTSKMRYTCIMLQKLIIGIMQFYIFHQLHIYHIMENAKHQSMHIPEVRGAFLTKIQSVTLDTSPMTQTSKNKFGLVKVPVHLNVYQSEFLIKYPIRPQFQTVRQIWPSESPPIPFMSLSETPPRHVRIMSESTALKCCPNHMYGPPPPP